MHVCSVSLALLLVLCMLSESRGTCTTVHLMADCTYVTVKLMVRVVVCLSVCLSLCLSVVCHRCRPVVAKRSEIRPRLLLITNRKSHIGF